MSETPPPSRLVRWLSRVERVGNKLPDPLTLFFLMAAGVVVVSMFTSGVEADVVQRSGDTQTLAVKNLMSAEGIRWMFSSAVQNFIGFAPLGPVLTVMIGIGVAERTGFISTGLRVLVTKVPPSMITATLVFGGVMSSMAADAGYVVLTPLGALLFASLGRHPLAGLAAAYAGVSGGFSANLLITGLDPMLSRLTQQAAQTIDPSMTVNPACNWYFMIASTVLVTVIGTLVTRFIVEPMLGEWSPEQGTAPVEDEKTAATNREARAFLESMGIAAIAMAVMVWMGVSGPLVDEIPAGAPAVDALHTFFESIEIIVAIGFILPGIYYGIRTGTIRNDRDVAGMMTDTMATMGAYVVLAFAAGQFVAFFNWTNLGAITAVKGADILQSIGLEGGLLLIAFLVVSGLMNFLVGSASAKWAFMAPIFVPMLMLMGISPEATQAAYRVGDSITNIISPLMPYLPIIIVFAQKYDKKAGLGTIIAAMLPYSIAFAIAWTIMLLFWVYANVPLGPGAYALMP
ncbi:MAG: aminobenzoyl-glutamate transport protein [Bradymonadia bacterium]|jgi:aminobenzoyl-glutamate transport protein